VPWHGHYWPSHQWGLTRRLFDFSQSPLEKFETAFAQQLSQANPNYQVGQLAQMEVKRVLGVTETWFGICDGVSEAANFFPEPTDPITVGGVTFFPFEVKALLGYFVAMSGPSRKFVFAGQSMTDLSASFDVDGRALTRNYRNINPGLFHLVLSNIVGLKHSGIVVDVTPDHLVLNFPVRSYSVRNLGEVVDPFELARLKAYNPNAKQIFKAETLVEYADSHRVLEPLALEQSFFISYTYSLELNDRGEIVGGEWLDASRSNHPNFVWMAETPSIDIGTLATDRLETKILVGSALSALLATPSDQAAGAQASALKSHRDNLSPYGIFRADAVPPVPADIVPLLEFVPGAVSIRRQ
jgi:hypothetical protein